MGVGQIGHQLNLVCLMVLFWDRYFFYYTIYINDITQNISSEIRLFADDCILSRRISSLHDCAALQQDTDTLFAWSETWRMHFNPSQ